MKFVLKDMGEAAEINSGGGNQWKELGKLMSLAFILIVSLYALTVFLSEFFISGISIEDEKRWLGKINLVHQQSSVETNNSQKLDKANDILSQLSKHAEVPQLDYKLIEIDTDELNAFAFPGGTIGVTRGLLEALPNESALAFVLAHELGHFKHRHHLKGFSRALSFGVIFSIVFGNNSDLLVTQNIITLLDARHSQQQELDSDNFGVTIVVETFSEYEQLDGFFQLIKDKQNTALAFLSTHPNSDARIDNLNQLLLTLKTSKFKQPTY